MTESILRDLCIKNFCMSGILIFRIMVIMKGRGHKGYKVETELKESKEQMPSGLRGLL